jgi:tRNA(Ile)-lysidine synthase
MPRHPPSDPIVDALAAALAALRGELGRPHNTAALRIAVALSGGRDSMLLLDTLAALAPLENLNVSAVHVHHGLSPNADEWAQFCERECTRRGVPLAVHRVEVARTSGAGVEAAARAARYAALSTTDADALMLAHHADDQAETVLLQLMRGAGPLGLAAMPGARAGAGPRLLRPLLALPASVIDACARARGLAWIDDESNADVGLRRNFLRHEIAPRLARAFPGYPVTLVRSAAHCAEAAALADELARIDAAAAITAAADGTRALDRVALAGLAATSMPRARNLLRWFIRVHRLPLPSSARLAAMLDQLLHAAPDARVRLAHAGAVLGAHRGRVCIHAPPVARYDVCWTGEPALQLPHGTLRFVPVHGTGLSAARAHPGELAVRPRAGGERMRLVQRPTRPVRRLLQEAGVPEWLRDGWPLVWCDDALAAIPGIGVAEDFAARPDAPGIALDWRPAAGASIADDDAPAPPPQPTGPRTI